MLTTEDIAEIKKTWEIPSADPPASGSAILIRFFTKYPSNLQKFPFRDVPVDKLKESARFRAHCTRIIGTFDQSIQQLGQEDGLAKVQAIWEEIGKTHTLKHKISKESYLELREALVEVLTEVCKLNEKQQQAWTKLLDIVYGIIFKKMEELQAKQ